MSLTQFVPPPLHHPVCCITDVEPDDFLAILAAIASGIKFHSFLIIDRSKEDVWDRLGRFLDFQKLVKEITNVPIYHGEPNTLHPHLLSFVDEHHSALNANPIVICLAINCAKMLLVLKNPLCAILQYSHNPAVHNFSSFFSSRIGKNINLSE